MRILLFGTNGQVGWELQRSLQRSGEVVALSRTEADFEVPASLRACFGTRFDVIVNAVAYTAVDQAEQDEERAMRINAEAVGVLAEQARLQDALLIHYSTDYVFDGTSATPYPEDAVTDPQSAYGRSKRAGEIAIERSGCRYLILRTSWVFASRGRNFLRTILRLAAERETLRIVGDQHGAPTSARLIADCTATVIDHAIEERRTERFVSRIHHLTASGRTTWHGLATHIVDHARARAAVPLAVTAIESIATREYPVPARRPANSLLDTSGVRERFGVHLPDWRVGVDLCLEEVWAS